MSPTRYVYGFNCPLPQLVSASYDVMKMYTNLNDDIRRKRALPLKTILNKIYNDFIIPFEIVDIIALYQHGYPIFHYADLFEQHIDDVCYVTPIILGYTETILFITLFISALIITITFPSLTLGAIIRHLSAVILIYAFILFIHGLCAFISYYYCSKYEQLIRKLKHILHSKEEFYAEYKNTYFYENVNVNQERFIHLNHTEKRFLSLSNPSNNAFAYIAFQRWINVKELHFENDKYTQSPSALRFYFTKYCLISLVLFYTDICFYCNNKTFFGGLAVTFMTFTVFPLLVEYFLVKHHPLLVNNRKQQFVYGFVVITPVIFVGYGYISDDPSDVTEDMASLFYFYYILGISWLVLLVPHCIYSTYCIIKKIHKIIKQSQLQYIMHVWIEGFECFGRYSIVLFLLCNVGVLLVINRFVIIIFWFLMSICLYLWLQQHIETVLSGLSVTHYVQYYFENNAKKWIQREIQSLFSPIPIYSYRRDDYHNLSQQLI